MVNALDMKRLDPAQDSAIDMAVLDQILDMGDARLRAALLEQLLADFRRLSEALMQDGWDEVSAAAHELKGLAATIGAHRLAQLAKRLDTVADCAIPGELGEFRSPVEGEMRIVLDTLAMQARRVQS